MPKTITLPSGNTAVFKDFETLLKKDRDKVSQIANEQEGQLMQAIALTDGLIAVTVVSWSFDLIPPAISVASLGELTPKDYQALANEAMKAQEYLFPALEANGQVENDPKADTANSNA